MSIAALREKRAATVAEMRAIHDTAANDNRELSGEESARFETLKTEARAIETKVGRAEHLADLERRAESPADATMTHEHRGYSIARAIRGSLNGKLDGAEGEAHAELSRGREVRGVMVPSTYLLGEQRAQLVGLDPSGGYLVGGQMAAVADRFRPALKVEAMGATVLRNLTGYLDLPNLANSGTAHWIGEHQAPTRSDVDFELVTMGPKTVAGEYEMSRRLMLQSNESIEDLLRRDLGALLAQALDSAAIKRRGNMYEPAGILDTSGLEKVTTEASFSDTTANLIGALELDDVTPGSRGFLTNPKVMKAARKIKDGEGRLIPIPMLFHNERVETTNQAPDDIGVSSDKNALLYGQWNELFVAYWSGVDILLNPYHSDVASKGGALLHAFLDADAAVRHVEAFAYAEIT